MRVAAGSTVSGSTSSSHSDSGCTGSYVAISDSVAFNNTNVGVHASEGSISDSVAGSNGTGFSVGNGTITGCTAVDNQRGILGHGLILNNRTFGQSGFGPATVGVDTDGSRARVEGNAITFVATSVRASAPGSLIISNSFTNVTMAVNAVAGNRVDALVTGMSSAAINGNSDGGLGTTDPHANVIH